MTFVDKIKELYQSVKDIFANYSQVEGTDFYSENGSLEVGTALFTKNGDNFELVTVDEFELNGKKYKVVDSTIESFEDIPDPVDPVDPVEDPAPVEDPEFAVTAEDWDAINAKVAGLEAKLTELMAILNPTPVDPVEEDGFSRIDKIFAKFKSTK